MQKKPSHRSETFSLHSSPRVHLPSSGLSATDTLGDRKHDTHSTFFSKRIMHRYNLGHTLGEGAFGQVRQATHKETGEQVAIKTLKDRCRDFNTMMDLPEVKVCLALCYCTWRNCPQALRNVCHENVVKCKELILDSKGFVHIVFELLPGGNLEMVTRKRRDPFTEFQIRSIFYQLLRATSYMHSLQYMHRDIKPENILFESSSLGSEIKIKLADLGLAKLCEGSKCRPHTTYVATRWYRSPELLLRISSYSYPSDLWAIGAVMAEVVSLGEPLFPGEDESDQIARVVSLRGHPSMVGWKKGMTAMKNRHIQLAKTTPSSLRSAVPRASLPVLQLISDLLEMDPDRRPSAAEALGYPVFLSQHLDKDEHFQARKKQKLDSAGLDTGRTRDYPSSRVSFGSENEEEVNIRHSKTKHFNMGNGKSSSRQEALAAFKSFHGAEDDNLFNIPELSGDTEANAIEDQHIFRRRRPAGNFDMRSRRGRS